MKTVLLATTGMSPAVLTETVWALAREKPAVVPDEVYVVTTVSGAAKLKELSTELRRRINHRITDVGRWLQAVLLGCPVTSPGAWRLPWRGVADRLRHLQQHGRRSVSGRVDLCAARG